MEAVALIEKAHADGCAFSRACEMIGLEIRTFERWRNEPSGDQRRGPKTSPANKLSADECAHILETANSSSYRDKSPAQIVPSLADKGIYLASESTFCRLLKQAGLNKHRSRTRPASRARPEGIVATSTNQVWSWDITFLKSNITGMFFYLYLVMDIYSRKIVGFSVHENQSSDHAASMITNICRNENVERKQLTLHSDNGKPMKGATMLATLQRLGVVPSFSRPCVSDDNPFSESLFKTLKYCPKFPTKPFKSAFAASQWVEEFVHWYNEEHLHSGIRFVTPSSRHRGADVEQLSRRNKVYAEAKLKSPTRWSGATRNWDQIGEVFLNCLKRKSNSCSKKAA